ncbi:MAG: type II toxin-antitoxin system HigB family toxin [Parashewanella sp.]
MRLIGMKQLQALSDIERNIDIWIAVWSTDIQSCNWKEAEDLKNLYPRCTSEGKNEFIFSVGTTKHRIRLKLFFNKGIALIKEVIRDE